MADKMTRRDARWLLGAYKKATDDGDGLFSVPAALVLCAETKTPVPQWLAEQSADRVVDALAAGLPRLRGRSSNPIARRLQDNVDSRRYLVAETARGTRTFLKSEGKRVRASSDLEDQTLAETYRWCYEDLRTNDLMYEWVSRQLAGTRAQGSAASMKRSHLKLTKELRRNAALPRYWLYGDLDKRLGTQIPIGLVSKT
jgi:hypothetical protein